MGVVYKATDTKLESPDASGFAVPFPDSQSSLIDAACNERYVLV